MLHRAVYNFLKNAVSHSPGDSVIRLKAKTEKEEIIFSVYNSKSHIPEEDLEKIWIKFYKVDKARTRAYGGSGIGLSIVKAIMDSMNQQCGVKNYDNGVEFWFELEAKA